MEERATIYAYGNFEIRAEDLILLLQQYHINCVVDCRPLSNMRIGWNTPKSELIQALAEYNIVYIPFYNHFGLFPPETRNTHGTILYKRAVATTQFQQGIERIKQGVNKGYTICIIDEVRDFYKSRLYNIIAQRLKEEYNIIYLLSNGYHFTQEQIEKKKEEKAQRRQYKNAEKQALGRNGEEIAALYLIRNGYQILDHNWNLHHGCELDIVAYKEGKLHFIEVKTRSSDRYGPPQNAINETKLRHIIHAIQEYRYRRNFNDYDYQIDSIAILYRADNDYDLNHFLGIHLYYGPCDEVVTYTQRPYPTSTY
jgi:putative endonuclease